MPLVRSDLNSEYKVVTGTKWNDVGYIPPIVEYNERKLSPHCEQCLRMCGELMAMGGDIAVAFDSYKKSLTRLIEARMQISVRPLPWGSYGCASQRL